MKRWTFRIVLCLLLGAPGAVTTVAVAWGLAVLVRPTEDESRQATIEHPSGTIEEHRYDVGFGRSRLKMNFFYFLPLKSNDPALSDIRGIDGSGWPVLSLEYYLVQHRQEPWLDGRPPDGESVIFVDELVIRFDRVQGGIEVTPYDTGDRRKILRALPYTPILLGFLIDTLFYAVIWFGLFFGIGAILRGQRALRRKRGRCVKCGYDLRGSPDKGCPECGWGREDGTTNDELRTTSEE